MPQSRQDDQQLASIRETVESIWVAIVLAFVLRAFVLEAFVIPTGSMAPRLMGRHWQFDCPACKHHYAFGITDRIIQSGPGAKLTKRCPNCDYREPFTVSKPLPYGGDRVLVLKYLYRFREPLPWDVVVFKNPYDNKQNYIKRLIGLPGQMIEIVHGDIFFRQGDDYNNDRQIDEADFLHPDAELGSPWRILRKSPKTQEVMWQVVFDNDHQPAEEIYEKGGNQAWVNPWGTNLPTGWEFKAGHGNRVLEFAGSKEPAVLGFNVDREWFCPIYGYNGVSTRPPYDRDTDVASDLKLSFMFVPKAADGRVGLHLSSFDHHFRAWVGADGHCQLQYGQETNGKVTWDDSGNWPNRIDLPPLELDRGHDVALTHTENRVTLWLDGLAVIETDDRHYPTDREWLIANAFNSPQDSAEEYCRVPTPRVAIVGSGGASELWHIKVLRDVFYTYAEIEGAGGRTGHGATGNPMVLRKFFDDPDMDEFYVLGDNSPQSKDSRMWGTAAPSLRKPYRTGTVPRYNMIGKAFFVYWPGGYRLPLLKDFPKFRNIGIVPNVGRMRLIR